MSAPSTAAPPKELAASEAAGAAAAEASSEDRYLMSHSYDGIREFDNPLPGWWSAVFLATIVFAAAYGVYYHIADRGPTPAQRYEASLADYLARRTFSGGGGGSIVAATEASLARDSHSDVVLEKGAQVFAERCASCHTADGRGQVGPNLTDRVQLHGASRMDILNTISNGVTGTAMIAWSQQLSAAEVNAVAAFVITLRGKNLPGKEPQGKPVGDFDAVER